jgi:hypothetical protein
LNLHVDYGHRSDPNVPALRLFADVVLDAVDLVRGSRHASTTHPAKQADVAAASAWIRNGKIGVLSFNDCCGWLGWDAEHVRRAIFSPPRGARRHRTR